MPKLKPLEEWKCDACGGTMSADEAYLEWLEASGSKPHSFRTLHNRHGCLSPRSVRDNKDGPLRQFLGINGQQCFLSFLDVGRLLDPQQRNMPVIPEMASFVDVWRRLQMPYYEEARLYLAAARQDGEFGDQNEVSVFLPDTCLSIIKRYEE